MKRIQTLILLAIAVCGTITVSYAQRTHIDRALEPFTSLSVNGPVKVELIPAEEEGIEVNLWDMETKSFTTKVKEGKLILTARKGMVNKHAFANVKLYYRSLDQISISGGDVRSDSPVKTGSLRLEASGSVGKIDLAVEVNDITIQATGENIIRVSGEANMASYQAKMSSRIECFNLQATHVDAVASGKGEVQVYSLTLLNARATTSGTIFYKGDPEGLSVKTNLGGAVEPIGLVK